MNLPDYVTYQPFETQFFSGPVWRLEEPAHAADAVALARSHNVRLMSCRLPEPDERSSYLARAEFRKVEVLLTLGRDLSPQGMPDGIRVAACNPVDAAACAAIGRNAFQYDRFHADPMVQRDAADSLKETWVHNDVMGRADCVLVAELDGRIVGFNACLLRTRTAIIDLIGVDPETRGKGIGKRLVQAMSAHYAGKADRIQLGTQLANERSRAFYTSLGFEEEGCRQTWHWTPGD